MTSEHAASGTKVALLGAALLLLVAACGEDSGRGFRGQRVSSGHRPPGPDGLDG